MRAAVWVPWAALAFSAVLATAGRADGPDPEATAFFESQVRPLLARSCFGCHGPAKQQHALRLDSRPAVLKGGERGPAVVPGQPDRSLLLRAVGQDGALKMPPGGKLTGEQVAVLTRWVRMGAPWPEEAPAARIRAGPITAQERSFWSFRPVANPPVPAVKDTSWPRSEIDRFILAALEAKGLRPAAPADRRTLIRRATFDLTGLPPTPEEVEAFVNDTSPDAFAKVVDRLLASPAYGERWGRHWLDVARYADTAGETADYPVPDSWRYRNYVIDAFNADKPYDEFLREQIAGDVLALRGPPGKYAERVTATGFLALSRRFGYDPEHYEHLTIQDTIDTLGQSVLGLTLGCARCHDHKFDPVTTEDYYALYGIFASTRYAFAGSERQQLVRAMAPLAPPAEAASRWEAFDREMRDNEQELARLKAPWTKVTVRSLADLDGDFELQAASAGGSLGLPSSPWQSSGGVSVSTAAQGPYTNLYPAGSNGIHFPEGTGEQSLGQGISPAWTASSGKHLYFNIDYRNSGGGPGTYRICLGHGPGRAPAVEVLVGAEAVLVRAGSAVELVRALKPGTWYNLQLDLDLGGRTFSGTVGSPGDVVSFAGKPFSPGWDGRIDYLLIDGKGHTGGARPAHDVDNVGLRGTPFRPVATEPARKGETLTAVPMSPAERDQRRASALRRLEALVEEGPFPQAYAVAEGTPHDACIQKRGEPERPGKVVPRRFLEILGGDPLPAGADGSGRLELAEWLTRPPNPLTARVMVNRIWQHHFGKGLVATENDFGARGKRPTHPELLDYLAARFVASGWSVKAMHRLIMLSQVYQTSGVGDPRAAEGDPADELLSWFPRRRLDAESIRDAMLAVGGNLDRTPGSRHPFPAAGECRFTQHSPFQAVYPTNRRSVYLMVQRTRRHPYLALFDGADPNASTARRGETTVPTQALFLMNDPVVHEQAAGLARRLLATRPDEAGRVQLGFEIALARGPSAEELAETLEFLGDYRRRLEADHVPAEQRDVQAWSAFARTLLARNEFLFLD